MAKQKIVRLKVKFEKFTDEKGTQIVSEERLALKVRGGYYPLKIVTEQIENYPNITEEQEIGEIEITKETHDRIIYHFE